MATGELQEKCGKMRDSEARFARLLSPILRSGPEIRLDTNRMRDALVIRPVEG
jgi:hypothetical protein